MPDSKHSGDKRHKSQPGSTLSLSIVIPVFNADEQLARCLAAIRQHNSAALEIVVVDDASTRGDPGKIARQFGAKIIKMPENAGPAVARNVGVNATDSELIMFIDADVVVHADTIDLARKTMASDCPPGAAFGSYDESPDDPGFLSQYRNLYHRWIHQQSTTQVSTFWTGCGVVTRAAFEQAGGFDPQLSRRGMEDIDLGYRISAAGYRIDLIKSMQCQHLKRWSLQGMITTDIFHRGVPWMLILLARPPQTNDLNISPVARIATIAAASIVPLLLAALWQPVLLWLTVVSVATIVALQWGFYRTCARLKGAGFALAVVPAQVVFFTCCALSIPLAMLQHFSGNGLQPWPPDTA